MSNQPALHDMTLQDLGSSVPAPAPPVHQLHASCRPIPWPTPAVSTMPRITLANPHATAIVILLRFAGSAIFRMWDLAMMASGCRSESTGRTSTSSTARAPHIEKM